MNSYKFPEDELGMISDCGAIGMVSESNAHFTFDLIRMVRATGKPFEELTIREAIALIDGCNEAFNRRFAS